MCRSLENMAICILAAGESRRMGRPKQLLPWGDTTLLGNAIRQARGTQCSSIYVVLGAYAPEIGHSLEEDRASVEWITNEDWKDGLGGTISFAVEEITRKQHDLNGILFMLADQPLVDSGHIDRLLKTFVNSDSGIVATGVGDGVGVPAVFSNVYFSSLGELEGKKGAQEIIKEHREDLLIILSSIYLITDIDTPEVYQKLYRNVFGRNASVE